MLEVKPNKEILKIKTSIMGVSPWQLGWIIAGIIAGSVVYYILPFPAALRTPCVVPVVLFFCSVGFIDIDGMNLFQLIKAVITTGRLYRRPLVVRGRKEDYDVTEHDNEE